MSVKISSITDHKRGQFYIDVLIDGKRYKRCSSMAEANEFVRHEKDRAGVAKVEVTLREIIYMLMKTELYETAYSI